MKFEATTGSQPKKDLNSDSNVNSESKLNQAETTKNIMMIKQSINSACEKMIAKTNQMNSEQKCKPNEPKKLEQNEKERPTAGLIFPSSKPMAQSEGDEHQANIMQEDTNVQQHPQLKVNIKHHKQDQRAASGMLHHQSPRKENGSSNLEETINQRMRESLHFKQLSAGGYNGSSKKLQNSTSKDKDRDKSSDSVYTSILKNLNGKLSAAGGVLANPSSSNLIIPLNNQSYGNLSNNNINGVCGSNTGKRSNLMSMVSPQSKKANCLTQGKFFSNEKIKESSQKLGEAFSRKQPLIDKENFDLLLRGK